MQAFLGVVPMSAAWPMKMWTLAENGCMLKTLGRPCGNIVIVQATISAGQSRTCTIWNQGQPAQEPKYKEIDLTGLSEQQLEPLRGMNKALPLDVRSGMSHS